MTSRRKLVAVLLGASLASLTGLFVYSCSVSPRDARISELGQDDIGAFVRIRGHVRSVTTVGSGGVRVDMLDYADYSSISAYLSAKVFHSLDYSANIKPGAFLELAGEVEVFNGRVEVSVQNGESVKLLARVDDNIIGLGTLARNPLTFSGMTVVVRGVFSSPVSIMDWGKLLAVAGPDRIWVDYGGGGRFSEEVDIFGKVLFNEERRRFEIKAAGRNDSVSPHGQVSQFGYEEATLQTLAESPWSWEGRNVVIVGVRVMAGEVVGTSFSLSDIEEGDRYAVSCMVFGWDWSDDHRGLDNETAVEFLGTWGYYSARAQWQVTSDQFTLRV